MKPDRATNQGQTALLRQLEHRKIALVEPSNQFPAAFMVTLLQAESGHRLLYYRAPGRAATLTAWTCGLFAALVQEGLLAESAIPAAGATPVVLATHLADVLNASHIVVYCDDFDRLKWSADAVQFFDTLLARMDGPSRLVLNGRVLIMAYWKQQIAAGTVAMFSDTENGAFATSGSDRVHVEVFAFGRGRVLVNGADVVTWDGMLPRHLFHFFVDRVMVRRDTIFQEFWPDLKPRDATNVFHVTKRKIAECLSIRDLGIEVREFTRYESGFYMPAESIDLSYDVARFQHACEQGSGSLSPAETEASLRDAVALYRGDFLEDVQDIGWVALRREELRESAIDAYATLIELARADRRYEDALGYGVRALMMAPEEISLHRMMVELYSALQRPQDAARQIEHMDRLLMRGQGNASASSDNARSG